MNLPLPRLTRPRVEGDRQQEILAAALTILTEVGYDRLTLDAVSKEAKVSKATLYRHWNGKLDLIIDALSTGKAIEEPVPDLGDLREELLIAMCGHGGLDDRAATAQFASVLTATMRDPEFADAFRQRLIEPKIARSNEVWQRAADRGELRDDVDLDLLTPALAGIVLHRAFLLGDPPSREVISRVVDQIILPAALKPGLLAGADSKD
jgi:AcrR family transcriptional regulator